MLAEESANGRRRTERCAGTRGRTYIHGSGLAADVGRNVADLVFLHESLLRTGCGRDRKER